MLKTFIAAAATPLDGSNTRYVPCMHKQRVDECKPHIPREHRGVQVDHVCLFTHEPRSSAPFRDATFIYVAVVARRDQVGTKSRFPSEPLLKNIVFALHIAHEFFVHWLCLSPGSQTSCTFLHNTYYSWRGVMPVRSLAVRQSIVTQGSLTLIWSLLYLAVSQPKAGGRKAGE